MVEHKTFGCTENRETPSGKPRVAFASQACYFDTCNEASFEARSLMECLATLGFPTLAMTGTVIEVGKELDPGNWLAGQVLMPEFFDGQAHSTSQIVPQMSASPHYRLTAGGVQVVLHRSPTTHPHVPEEPEIAGFLGLLESVLDEFQPDVVVSFGGHSLAEEIRRRARARGIAVVLALHDFHVRNRVFFKTWTRSSCRLNSRQATTAELWI